MYTTKQQMSQSAVLEQKTQHDGEAKNRNEVSLTLEICKRVVLVLQFKSDDLTERKQEIAKTMILPIIKTIYKLIWSDLVYANFSLSFLDFSRCHKHVFSNFPDSLTLFL